MAHTAAGSRGTRRYEEIGGDNLEEAARGRCCASQRSAEGRGRREWSECHVGFALSEALEILWKISCGDKRLREISREYGAVGNGD